VLLIIIIIIIIGYGSARFILFLDYPKKPPSLPINIHAYIYVRKGRVILNWIFRKGNVGVSTGSSWLRILTGGGHL
jgi:hypothetical protein